MFRSGENRQPYFRKAAPKRQPVATGHDSAVGRREMAFRREGQWRSRRAPGNCSRRGGQPPENTDRRVETMEARNPRSTAVNDANPRKRGKQIGAERLEKKTVFNRRRGKIKFAAKKTKEEAS